MNSEDFKGLVINHINTYLVPSGDKVLKIIACPEADQQTGTGCRILSFIIK